MAGRSSSVKGPRDGRGHHVIIEAVIGRRAKGDLRAGKQRLHRLGQHMRKVMPGQLERIGLVLRGDQRQLRIAVQRPHDVAQFAIDPRGERRLGKARANAAAMSAGVVPRATSRAEPSGRVTRIISEADIGKRCFLY